MMTLFEKRLSYLKEQRNFILKDQAVIKKNRDGLLKLMDIKTSMRCPDPLDKQGTILLEDLNNQLYKLEARWDYKELYEFMKNFVDDIIEHISSKGTDQVDMIFKKEIDIIQNLVSVSDESFKYLGRMKEMEKEIDDKEIEIEELRKEMDAYKKRADFISGKYSEEMEKEFTKAIENTITIMQNDMKSMFSNLKTRWENYRLMMEVEAKKLEQEPPKQEEQQPDEEAKDPEKEAENGAENKSEEKIPEEPKKEDLPKSPLD